MVAYQLETTLNRGTTLNRENPTIQRKYAISRVLHVRLRISAYLRKPLLVISLPVKQFLTKVNCSIFSE